MLPKITALAPKLVLARPLDNAAILNQYFSTSDASFILTPELSLTGYTCQDLFLTESLLQHSMLGLQAILDAPGKPHQVLIVGAPLRNSGQLFNCAIAIVTDAQGRRNILGVTVKTHLPNYNEFYERRWFSPATAARTSSITLLGTTVPFGAGLVYHNLLSGLKWGIEICEDLWAVIPPSATMALNGAHIIFNLSASNELLGKAHYRKELVTSQSGRLICAYAYASSGLGESGSDTVFSGHLIIAENDKLLSETQVMSLDTTECSACVSIIEIDAERRRNTTFGNHAVTEATIVPYSANYIAPKDILRHIARNPFVPEDPAACAAVCEEVIRIQIAALTRKLAYLPNKDVTIGVSGGLDSLLALLIAYKTSLAGGLSTIHGITMPGLGTTSRTLHNSLVLMDRLSIVSKQLNIANSALTELKSIGHNGTDLDITYENVQARARAATLFNYANLHNTIVLGTGNLSELALGWMTYFGDSESHYHINAGIPKTLVRAVVSHLAHDPALTRVKSIILDILATPVSPELLPVSAAQTTEGSIGPYDLHDFFLYWSVRKSLTPTYVKFMAANAIPEYTDEEITKWYDVFTKRFLANQFKRQSMPDGLKIGSLSLSPRGDWRMPSDLPLQ